MTGRSTASDRVAEAPAGQGSSAADATIPTYISLDDPSKARGLDKAPVGVDITTKGVDSALSVPVTALVGKSGGGFAVEVVRAGERRELVAVKRGPVRHRQTDASRSRASCAKAIPWRCRRYERRGTGAG